MAACESLFLCALQFLAHLMRPAPQQLNEMINFGAGPGQMPQEVLLEMQKELIYYDNTSMGVMEMSHRSIDYMNIHKEALRLVREI